MRIVKPLNIGDTIQVKLSISKKQDSKKPELGQVTEHVEVFNQKTEIVLIFDHVLLVKKNNKT